MAKPKPINALGKNPRDLTTVERVALFTKRKKAEKNNWKVLKPSTEEVLVPFNRLSLDYGLKLFGMARMGSVYHFHGDEGSGKTSIVVDIVNEYIRSTGEPAAYYDYERRLKSWYLRAQGVDESKVFVLRPDSIEEGTKSMFNYMNDGVRLFVFDSIPRMKNKVDLKEVESGDAFKTQQLGRHATAIQQFYDIVLPYLASNDCTIIMINQTRSRIDVSAAGQQAAKYATVTNLNYSLPGGRANRYATSVMVENRLARAWKYDKRPHEFAFEAEGSGEYACLEIAHRTLKNTISGTGYRSAKTYIRPGRGVDENISIRMLAKELHLIENHGKRWYLGESIDEAIHVFDNKADAVQALVTDEDEEILAKLKSITALKMQSNDALFRADVSDEEARFAAGETDEEPDITSGPLAVDNEDDEL
jgi:RecA/RadA recombinase